MAKKRRRRRKQAGSARRPKVERAQWHHAPNGKRLKAPCGAEIMRVGGDIAVIHPESGK